MAKNVEIKAKAEDFSAQLQRAVELSGNSAETIKQQDTFFAVDKGRLKLRVLAPDRAQLVFYHRSDVSGPKVSEYAISESNDPIGLSDILDKAYGITAQVNKTRQLVMSGRTRIHFDQVDDLGEFIELEVVLSDGESLADGQTEAETLMAALGIEDSHLIDVAYVDLIAREG